MNRQEVFDKAVGSVIKQGEPAFRRFDGGTDGQCQYVLTNSEGKQLHCAIGHLFRPEYLLHLANNTNENMQFEIRGMKHENPGMWHELQNTIGEITESDVVFLSDIQRAHDQSTDNTANQFFVERFTDRVRSIAGHYKLDWNF